MKPVAALLFALTACGGPPLLANAPHPNNAAMAGGFAAAAAAITLASPTTAAQRAEQKTTADTRPIPVKENVPPAVLDRLDAQEAAGSASARPATKPARTPAPHERVHLPSPSEAAAQAQPADSP